jgi:hypothetical protein
MIVLLDGGCPALLYVAPMAILHILQQRGQNPKVINHSTDGDHAIWKKAAEVTLVSTR